MSKGRPILSVRVSEEMLDQIDEAMDSRNARSAEAPWTRADFVLACIRDRLLWLERSRRLSRQRRARVRAARAKGYAMSAPETEGGER